jgi:hypothetical protein
VREDVAINYLSFRDSLRTLRQLLISVLAYLNVDSSMSINPNPPYNSMLAAGSNSLATMSII